MALTLSELLLDSITDISQVYYKNRLQKPLNKSLILDSRLN